MQNSNTLNVDQAVKEFMAKLFKSDEPNVSVVFDLGKNVLTEFNTPLSKFMELPADGKRRIDLERDNEELRQMRQAVEENVEKLGRVIKVAQAVQNEVSSKNTSNHYSDVLEALKKRLSDLQNAEVVFKQGIISCDLLIRNNELIIKSLNRVSLILQRVGLDTVQFMIRSLETLLSGEDTNDPVVRAIQEVFNDPEAALKDLREIKAQLEKFNETE